MFIYFRDIPVITSGMFSHSKTTIQRTFIKAYYVLGSENTNFNWSSCLLRSHQLAVKTVAYEAIIVLSSQGPHVRLNEIFLLHEVT